MSSETESKLPTFVRRHLDNIARSQNLFDYTVEYKAGSKNGDGFTSKLLGVTLVSGDRRLPLICKLMLDQPADSSETNDMAVFFEREVTMYSTVLPKLAALQRKHNLTAEYSFLAYPKCYLAVSDGAQSIIVLEDLRATGIALWDKLVPFVYENVALLMQQLGRYHALSFVLRDQQPEAWDQLLGLEDCLGATCADSKVFMAIIGSSLEQAGEKLEQEQDKEVFRGLVPRWRDFYHTRTHESRVKRFAVLNHGDCHTNNMMFRLNSKGTPDAIVLIDWQASTVISPAVDLGNFMFWCTEKPLRDQHYDDFLRLYHAELSRVIAACGSDPEALFSYTDLLDQMREFGINALIMAPMAVTMLITPSEEMRSMATVEEALNGDDESQKQMAVLTANTEKRYWDRLLGIVTDARRLGYLEH